MIDIEQIEFSTFKYLWRYKKRIMRLAARRDDYIESVRNGEPRKPVMLTIERKSELNNELSICSRFLREMILNLEKGIR